MESVSEIFMVTETGSKDTNCTMYDIQTGNVLETYRESHSGRNGVDFINNEYLISAFHDRPKMKIWQFGQPNSVYRKMTTPGVVSALAVSKCGRYCIAGIGTRTFIWEVATGNLEAHLEYHVQDITCVRFSSDGSHFITGGQDGMVFVFFLVDAIIEQDTVNDGPKPLYTWADHAAEITDIYVGYLAYYSRVATVSNDMTCRIYELDTGNHLCTIPVDVPLTAVTMDMCEFFLFLGSVEGNIYKINLFNMSKDEMKWDDEKNNIFAGHKKEITSLCVSQSGKYLLSGSADSECRVWDIQNFSCFRKIHYNGPVTNVMSSLVPPGIKYPKYVPRLVTDNFKRVKSADDADELVPTTIANQTLSLFHAGTPDQFFDSRVLNCSTERLEKMLAQGTLTLDDLSRINNEMYSFAMDDVFDKRTTSGKSDYS